jgi:hypothetical protein
MRHVNVLVRHSPLCVIPMQVPYYEVEILQAIHGKGSIQIGKHEDVSFDLSDEDCYRNGVSRYGRNEDAGGVSWCEYVYGRWPSQRFDAAYAKSVGQWTNDRGEPPAMAMDADDTGGAEESPATVPDAPEKRPVGRPRKDV